MKRISQSFLLLAVCISAPVSAYAQKAGDYPSRPVRMVVPYAPGGATDFVARIVQSKFTEYASQQLVIDNRAGASGNIGVGIVADAAPDGYTMLLGSISNITINPSIFPAFRIRPLRDLIPVTQVADVPTALVANPSIPVSTVKEFIDYAKARPGKLNYASAGGGTQGRLEMEQLLITSGLKVVHIPYKGGAGAAAIATISGETAVALLTLPSVLPHVKQGRLKLLGVAAAERVPSAPSTLTLAESGFSGMRTGTWQGIFVPKGTSGAVIDRLFQIARKVMRDPEVVQRIEAGGAVISISKSPADFAALTAMQTERFAKLVKEIGGLVNSN